MKTNKKLGNDFEAEFCEILFENGFWAHNMAQNAAGQPADVIAVRNEKSYIIDCKVCSNGRFPLSRIEDNQHLSMKLWEESGNHTGGLRC
jgi:Holliday junction resolvase